MRPICDHRSTAVRAAQEHWPIWRHLTHANDVLHARTSSSTIRRQPVMLVVVCCIFPNCKACNVPKQKRTTVLGHRNKHSLVCRCIALSYYFVPNSTASIGPNRARITVINHEPSAGTLQPLPVSRRVSTFPALLTAWLADRSQTYTAWFSVVHSPTLYLLPTVYGSQHCIDFLLFTYCH